LYYCFELCLFTDSDGVCFVPCFSGLQVNSSRYNLYVHVSGLPWDFDSTFIWVVSI